MAAGATALLSSEEDESSSESAAGRAVTGAEILTSGASEGLGKLGCMLCRLREHDGGVRDLGLAGLQGDTEAVLEELL